jgi:TolB protein
MNRILAIALLLACSAELSLAAGSQQMVFERRTAIWMANVDGSNPRKIAKGSGPDLSPDGTRIAFNTDDSSKTDLVREIAIVEVSSKKVTLVKGIPSKNCQRAVWSPDGKQILFNLWNGNDWDLALIRPDGSGFRSFKKASPEHQSLWSTCWSADGKSIFAQDLDYIYRFDLGGQELKKWKVDSLFPNGGMNSGAGMSSSPDGKTLLIEVEMDEEVTNMPDWDGPPPSLWTVDLDSGKTTRLTKKGMLGSGGCWLDRGHILFNLFSPKEKEPTIYEMDLEKKEIKSVIKNGVNPSVSRAAGNG